jgi:hypothetical protein
MRASLRIVSAPDVAAREGINVRLVGVPVFVGNNPFNDRGVAGRTEQLGYFMSMAKR